MDICVTLYVPKEVRVRVRVTWKVLDQVEQVVIVDLDFCSEALHFYTPWSLHKHKNFEICIWICTLTLPNQLSESVTSFFFLTLERNLATVSLCTCTCTYSNGARMMCCCCICMARNLLSRSRCVLRLRPYLKTVMVMACSQTLIYHTTRLAGRRLSTKKTFKAI